MIDAETARALLRQAGLTDEEIDAQAQALDQRPTHSAQELALAQGVADNLLGLMGGPDGLAALPGGHVLQGYMLSGIADSIAAIPLDQSAAHVRSYTEAWAARWGMTVWDFMALADDRPEPGLPAGAPEAGDGPDSGA